MYADDTSTIIHSDNERLLQHKCNKLFTVLKIWFGINILFLNISKSGYIKFCNIQNKGINDFTILINS